MSLSHSINGFEPLYQPNVTVLKDTIYPTNSEFEKYIPKAISEPIKLECHSNSLTLRQERFLENKSAKDFILNGKSNMEGVKELMTYRSKGFSQFELPDFKSLIQDSAKMKELDALLK
jgi:hypothetical protein